jgi:hypothetical protein
MKIWIQTLQKQCISMYATLNSYDYFILFWKVLNA